ncbi:DUF6377 domain-containing protein [Flavobacterium sp. DG1-102-2]|uniref:DUF6377 domain-containing protein n=1 Tax=Flavobacterium sp. DG1-102-2 TaxID=3081663 RepID=UPI00294938E6|nr:DUF6377 domain-containing protein [Flavobacterium sp. DG1-102-2]MDV6169054.1 DUF6377 domain-containing protein [Flavobacterium sp. DG1-102-2]
MKNFLFISLLLVCAFCSAQNSRLAFAELDAAIKNKSEYSQKREERISGLKRLKEDGLSRLREYEVNKSLYKEYRKFRLDSAIAYIQRNLVIASDLNDEVLKNESQLQLANLYSSSGKFREAEGILKGINRNSLSKSLLPLYYEFYSQFFEHYATNSYNEAYAKKIEMYRDSLLIVLDLASVKYKIAMSQKNIYHNKIDIAQKDLLHLLETAKDKNADYAMTAYLLGDISGLKNNPEKQKEYYAVSATADIKNAIRDNAAVQNLALIFYEAGDIDNAYKFTRSAIEDAIFCNVKFRTLQMSELYSIINTAYLEKEAKGKSQLQLYLMLISILSFFLILAVVHVYKQMRRVSKIKEELYITSQKLAGLNSEITITNEQLHESNAQLSESNHVKEEYIAHFFDLCSTYINKLEDYRKSLNRKAADKQLDELFKMLKSTTVVDNEIEELYKTFDTIFINLYPTFVKDFNALLVPEEQVTVKQGELLNTELRIFALVRLGITDSVKIAAFLRYSLSTIYNYRTKARNKAAVSRDEFEVMVSKIGLLPSRA